ncbi:hypothetical protein GC194_07230 [bacterium]|nr:hypothetical protein [bacterium]
MKLFKIVISILLVCFAGVCGAQQPGIYTISAKGKFSDTKLQVDSFGNIYSLLRMATGETILTKINPCGTRLWSRQVQMANPQAEKSGQFGHILQLYIGRVIYIIADENYHTRYGGFSRYMLHCFSKSGDYKWSKILPYNKLKTVTSINALVGDDGAISLFFYNGDVHKNQAYLDSLHYNVLRFDAATGKRLAQNRFNESDVLGTMGMYSETTPLINYDSKSGKLEILRVGGTLPEKLVLRYNDLRPLGNFTQNSLYKTINVQNASIDKSRVGATFNTSSSAESGVFTKGFDSLFMNSFKNKTAAKEQISSAIYTSTLNGMWLFSRSLPNLYLEFIDLATCDGYRTKRSEYNNMLQNGSAKQYYDVLKQRGLIFPIFYTNPGTEIKSQKFEVVRAFTHDCSDTTSPNWVYDTVDTLVINWQNKVLKTGKPFFFKDTAFTVKNALFDVIKNCGAHTWLPTDVLPNDTIICDNLFSIDVNADSIDARFLWNTGDTTHSITVKKSGYYYLTLSNGFCSVTDSVKITFIKQPIQLFRKNYTVCGGDSLQLQIENPVLYHIIAPRFDTIKLHESDTTYFVNQMGEYIISSTKESFCTWHDSFNLNISMPEKFLPNDTLACQNATVTLNISNLYRFYYYVNGLLKDSMKAAYELHPALDSMVFVKLIDSIGCTAVDTMWVHTFSKFAVSANFDAVWACRSDSFLVRVNALGGNEPYRYYYNGQLIKEDSAALVYRNLQQAPYELKVADNCNEQHVFSTYNTEKSLRLHVDFQQGDTILLGKSIGALATAYSGKISWYLNGSLYSQTNLMKFTPADTGLFQAKVLVSNEYCSDSAYRNYYVTQPIIYIPNVFSPNHDGTNDEWKPVCYKCRISNYEIYNRWGQRVFSGQKGKVWSGQDLSGAPVPLGVYMAIVSYYDESGATYVVNTSVCVIK